MCKWGWAERGRESLKQSPCWARTLPRGSISQPWDRNASQNQECVTQLTAPPRCPCFTFSGSLTTAGFSSAVVFRLWDAAPAEVYQENQASCWCVVGRGRSILIAFHIVVDILWFIPKRKWQGFFLMINYSVKSAATSAKYLSLNKLVCCSFK